MDNSIEYSRHLGILREEELKPSVLYQKSLKISKIMNLFLDDWVNVFS